MLLGKIIDYAFNISTIIEKKTTCDNYSISNSEKIDADYWVAVYISWNSIAFVQSWILFLDLEISFSVHQSTNIFKYGFAINVQCVGFWIFSTSDK